MVTDIGFRTRHPIPLCKLDITMDTSPTPLLHCHSARHCFFVSTQTLSVTCYTCLYDISAPYMFCLLRVSVLFFHAGGSAVRVHAEGGVLNVSLCKAQPGEPWPSAIVGHELDPAAQQVRAAVVSSFNPFFGWGSPKMLLIPLACTPHTVSHTRSMLLASFGPFFGCTKDGSFVLSAH